MATRTRARSCDGKQRHKDKATALRHIGNLARTGANPRRFQAYRCMWCDGWHVGHRPKPKVVRR